jgi:dUTPase
MSSKLIVKKLSKFAVIPQRGSEGAAGYDLSSAEDTIVPKRGKALVKTGFISFIINSSKTWQ